MKDSGKIIALLIDAENVSPKYINVILNEISTFGTPAYKRIYGDWTNPEMSSWKRLLLENNLTPIQQFSYTQGKNASDSAMIIDAMDILYSQNCDGFCIASSDSDFTRLASRLRESRMFVIGMGESKTPMAFKAACDTFKYLDILMKPKEAGNDAKRAKPASTKAASAKPASAKPARAGLKLSAKKAAEKAAEEAAEEAAKQNERANATDENEESFVPLANIVSRIKEIIDHDSDEDGYMSLSQVGSILGRIYPDFDTRNYGFSKLHKLIDATEDFETNHKQIPGGGRNLMVCATGNNA